MAGAGRTGTTASQGGRRQPLRKRPAAAGRGEGRPSKRPVAAAAPTRGPLKRPASATGAPRLLKRPASAVEVAGHVKRRPAAAKRQSAEPPGAAFVAQRAFREGEVVFTEGPFAAAQDERRADEHESQQPLFCATCARPAGPLEASLALATNRISRAELLGVARNVEGDTAALLKWLGFATKALELPMLGGSADDATEGLFVSRADASGGGHKAEGEEGAGDRGGEGEVDPEEADEACFCSRPCLERWSGWAPPFGCRRALRRRATTAAGRHAGVLGLAIDVALQAAAAGRRGDADDATAAALRPLLRCLDLAGGPAAAAAAPSSAAAAASSSSQQAPRPPWWPELREAHGLLARAAPGGAPPLEVFARVFEALDRFAWALSGATLTSPLAAYAEAACDATAAAKGQGLRGEPQQATAAEVLAPAVRALCRRLDRLEEEVNGEDEEAAGGGDEEEDEEDPGGYEGGGGGGAPAGSAAAAAGEAALRLPPPEEAQRTRPVLVPALFTDADIAAVKALSEELAVARREHRKHATSAQWRTRYLHAGGAFRDRAPELLERLVAAAKGADAGPGGWRLLAEAPDVQLLPRCIEHHLVTSGGALPDPTHFDGGSLLTIDVMLQDPGNDFEGGEFCTLESDGSTAKHAFGRGDALVFVSHKAHCVQPVRSGLRETLILELWAGEERRCDHRCQRHRGACPLEAAAAAGALAKRKPAELQEERPRSAERRRHRRPSSGAAAAPGAPAAAAAAVRRDAARAFAATAFEGLAFFERVAGLMARAEARSRRSPAGCGDADEEEEANVEVSFEGAAPVATVRALRALRRGEELRVAPPGGGSDEEAGGESEEEEDCEGEEEEEESGGEVSDEEEEDDDE